MIHSVYNRNGAFVYYEDNPIRIVEAMGSRVLKWRLDASDFQTAAGTGTDPTGYTATVVEVGVGTSEAEASDEAGFEVELVTAANENDGISLQHGAGDYMKARSAHYLYFGIKLQVADATETDILAGLVITDTAILGGVTDGIYFEKLDGSTSVSATTEKNSTETQTDSLATMANDTDIILEFVYNGTDVEFFVNGASVATHTANIPDDVALRPSIEFLAGSAGAKRLKIKWARAFQIG